MMIETAMIQLRAKSLKSSGEVGGGGSPPMMIEKVMIQLGTKKVCVYIYIYISADIARRVGDQREDYWIPKRG